MGTVRSLRDAPPAHYSIKVENFSAFLDRNIEKYESGLFEIGGYKWRMCLYPNGHVRGTGHISLSLAIADTESLPTGWEVNAYFTMFVFDNDKDKYLVIEDANDRVWRFREKRTEWGFKELISLDTFTNASNGYLFRDSCVFGVEIFVVNYALGESVALSEMITTTPIGNFHDWNIPKEQLSGVVDIQSDVFIVGGYKWRLSFISKDGSSTMFGFYLNLVDAADIPAGKKLFVNYELGIYKGSSTVYFHGAHKFSVSDNKNGCPNYTNPNFVNSNLWNDKLCLQVKLTSISQVS